MEKPTNIDLDSIVKWFAASAGAALLFLGRFFFSHFYEKLENHEQQLKKIEITLAKISTKLGIIDDEK